MGVIIMDKASVARFFGLIVALLAYAGINVPESLTDGLVMVVVGGFAIYTAWKDNDITKKAVERKELIKEIEGDK